MGFLTPDWPTPKNIGSLLTDRLHGLSQAPFDSFNTASHVGDLPEHVAQNRSQLTLQTGYPLQWLDQVHGTDIVELSGVSDTPLTADAAMTSTQGLVCVVQTADCLPVLMCDAKGSQVAAIHAGWRGMAGGILQKVVERFSAPPTQLQVFLGVAISKTHFEVGEDVYSAFKHRFSLLGLPEQRLDTAFKAGQKGKFHADLYQLARIELAALGLTHISGGSECTWRNAERYYSYRREGVTGRMASMIWLKPS